MGHLGQKKLTLSQQGFTDYTSLTMESCQAETCNLTERRYINLFGLMQQRHLKNFLVGAQPAQSNPEDLPVLVDWSRL